jgi:hypothetical protein
MLGVSKNGDRQELFVHGLAEGDQLLSIEVLFLGRVVFGIRYLQGARRQSTGFPFAVALRRKYNVTLPQTDWQFDVNVSTRDGSLSTYPFVATPMPDHHTAILSSGSIRPFVFSDAVPPAMLRLERVVNSDPGSISIIGWAVSLSEIRSVELSCDTGELIRSSLQQMRRDVAAWRPEYPNATESGFELTAAASHAVSGAVSVSIKSDDVMCYVSNLLLDLIEPAFPVTDLRIHCEVAYVFSDGMVFASGWVISAGDIASVRLAVDGKAIGKAALTGARGDVASKYPGLADAYTSGFRALGSLGHLQQGRHQLSLTAESSLGDRRQLIVQVSTTDRGEALRADALSVYPQTVYPQIGAIALMADCLHEDDLTAQTAFAWSSDKRELATRVAAGDLPQDHPLHVSLARAQLAAWSGRVVGNRETRRGFVLDHASLCLSNDALFMDMLFTQFVLRRYDLVASLLASRYRPACPLTVSVERNNMGSPVLECCFNLPHSLHLTFDIKIFEDEQSFARVLWLAWIFPQLAMYTRRWPGRNGRVLLSQWDCGLVPGLSYCDYREGYFLIPDPDFVSTEGYISSRHLAEKHHLHWKERCELAFWRGGTTGIPSPSDGGWRSLPRVRLCELARTHEDILDAGISSVVQLSDMEAAAIRASDLMRPYASFPEFLRYKYQIDIDGNTNSWPGLFHKLLTGSPVLKIKSPKGYQQWYYNKLKPWVNFVPVSSDMSDLIEKVIWLRQNEEKAFNIGRSGRQLANELTFQSELMFGVTVIERALHYFNPL